MRLIQDALDDFLSTITNDKKLIADYVILKVKHAGYRLTNNQIEILRNQIKTSIDLRRSSWEMI